MLPSPLRETCAWTLAASACEGVAAFRPWVEIPRCSHTASSAGSGLAALKTTSGFCLSGGQSASVTRGLPFSGESHFEQNEEASLGAWMG